MGVGHIAVGFASKRWATRTSLAWLVLAPTLIDLFWSVFVLTGIERARITPGITRSVPLDLEFIPYSHSLVACVGWGLLFAGGYYLAWYRDVRAGLILFAGVVSHWVLDWVSHRPDMPLLPVGGPIVGLGLWNYPLPAFLVEATMLAIGVGLYMSVTRARSMRGKLGFAALVAFLFLFNVAAYTSPPPPTVTPMAAGNLAIVLLVVLLFYVDKSREVTAQPSRGSARRSVQLW
jgi:hypothetical protein